jgi:catechol 2,3-dioxygenase-like lactoylglutathione lyase family enzyme
MEDDIHYQLTHHTTAFRVSNLERSRDWYETVFGCRYVYRDPTYRVITMERGPNCTLTLSEIDNPAAPIACAGENGSHMVFVVPDIEASRGALIARGGTPSEIIRNQGHCLFWIADPDGHRFAILQLLPE